MTFWQVAVIVLALGLVSVITLRFMPSAVSAAMDSEWLAVVIFGFIAVPTMITVSIAYGVWKLGNRGNP